MFDAILPTLSLDLTDLLDDSGDNFSDFFFFFQFPVVSFVSCWFILFYLQP